MISPKFTSAVIFALLVLPISAPAQTVRDHRSVGGLNLANWCSAQHGRNTKPVIYPPNSKNWACVKEEGRFVRPIPLSAACRRQYRNGKLTAELHKSDGSWICVLP
jgi:hypothetical protein